MTIIYSLFLPFPPRATNLASYYVHHALSNRRPAK